MAEFINTPSQRLHRTSDAVTESGMASFGRPVPEFRKTAALAHAREIGITDTSEVTGMISRAALQIERDEPYNAMEALMAYVDLTGAYRLLAVLCAEPETQATAKGRLINVRRSP